MGAVTVINWVTLDGVLQGPGRRDEDTRGGFEHGGWAAPFSGPEMGEAIGARTRGDFAWLFGKRSYDDLLASWNAQGGPFKESLNRTTKYVASRTARALEWENSVRLSDAAAEVAALKRDSPTNLVVMGSSVLLASLIAADLVDEYLLMIAPVALGGGRRLFPEGQRVPLRMRESRSTSTGALIALYEPVR